MSEKVFFAQDDNGCLRRWNPPDLPSVVRQRDQYGVALMMIREGCNAPEALARRILEEFTNKEG